jgi:hypothetical protein
MSHEEDEMGEGHSLAAWTGVIIALVGIAIGTVAFFFDVQWLVWAAAGLTLIGFIAGFILSRAGYGVHGAKTLQREH